MSYTEKFVAVQGSWTLVFEGPGDCSVQLDDDGPIEVHLGSAAPHTAQGRSVGTVLDDARLTFISYAGLESGDSVYVLSRQDEDNDVIVSGTGTSPSAGPAPGQ